MHRLSTAWKILRDLGPVWVAQRIKFEAEVRLGILKRGLPVSDRDFDSGNWLRSDSPADAEQLKRSLREQALFFFSSHELPRPHCGNGVQAQVDRVLSGELPYFGHQWIKTGFPSDWHLNALDGRRIGSEAHWSRIDLGSIHDVKFVWEPSRFSFVYLLVRAYAATQDRRYVDAFWTSVEDWAHKNPPNAGVNWASGQECAFRVMSWCFALFAFLESPSSTADRALRLVRMIDRHGERIAGFISYALSQRNNHGISEAVGLFTIGVLFPQLGRADEWRHLGRKLIIRQLRDQIYEDGSYIQHSFNYQRIMIDDVVWAFRLGELNCFPFPEESYSAVSKSVQLMLTFCDPRTGKLPNYGSNDGSLVLPLSSCDYTDHRPSLQAAAYLTRRELLFPDGPWNEQVGWLFGSELRDPPQGGRSDSHKDTVESKECSALTVSRDGISSGYLKLKARESYAMLRAAQYRHRPSQADQLHLDLWWRGENIACDAGTYLYNGATPWNNALATTSVHNTITVAGRDQMTRAGRFLWLDWAQAQVSRYDVNGTTAVESWHDGYAELGATHKRSVLALEHHDCWVVVDDIFGSHSGPSRLHWLFPDFEFAWEEDDRRLWLQTPAGSFQCCCHAAGAHASLARAGSVLHGSSICDRNLEVRGWRSLYYGEKVPALSLALEAEAPIRFISVLAPTAVMLLAVSETEVQLRQATTECVVTLGRGQRAFVGIRSLPHHQT